MAKILDVLKLMKKMKSILMKISMKNKLYMIYILKIKIKTKKKEI
jgi:hypothetical protein